MNFEKYAVLNDDKILKKKKILTARNTRLGYNIVSIEHSSSQIFVSITTFLKKIANIVRGINKTSITMKINKSGWLCSPNNTIVLWRAARVFALTNQIFIICN